MNNTPNDLLDFLTVNTLLREVMVFATTNTYQKPRPTQESLVEFNTAMQELSIIVERIRLLSEPTLYEHLERAACLYLITQHGLTDLLFCCPAAAEAKQWFDFQKEYKAREKQTEYLTQLIIWHQQLYRLILDRYPDLPIPFPNGFTLSTNTSTEAKQIIDNHQLVDHPLPKVQV